MDKEVSSEKTSEKALKKDEAKTSPKLEKELNGRSGPEPTRFGDWEKNGRCIDF